MKPPIRMIDDPTHDVVLRQDLQHCADDAGYDVAAGLARLGATLRASAATTTASEAAGASIATTTRATWLGLGAGAALIAGLFAAWLAARAPQTEEPPATAPIATTSTPATSTAPEYTAPANAEPSATQAVDDDDAETHSPAEASIEVQAPSVTRTPKPSLRRELDMIARVRSLVDRNPAVAYRLTHTIEREFPEGVLREERDGLRVIALWNMGDRARAQVQARRFLDLYPRSAMRARLQSIEDGDLP